MHPFKIATGMDETSSGHRRQHVIHSARIEEGVVHVYHDFDNDARYFWAERKDGPEHAVCLEITARTEVNQLTFVDNKIVRRQIGKLRMVSYEEPFQWQYEGNDGTVLQTPNRVKGDHLLACETEVAVKFFNERVLQ